MEIDITKIVNKPKDGFEAIDAMIKTEQKLLEALHIIQSALMFQEDADKEFHIKRMNKFFNEFSK